MESGSSGQARARERARTERRHVGARQCGIQPLDVAGQRPEVREQVMAEQNRLGPLEMGVTGQVHVGPGRPGSRDQHGLERDAPRRRWRAPSRSTKRRSAVATWSLRLRPVCSFAPASPASSVTRRSMAVWMSSSVGAKTNSPARQLALDGVERAEHGVDLVGAEQADPTEHAHVGARAREVVGREAPVEVQARGEREQRLGRPLGEPPVPQCPGLGGLVRHPGSPADGPTVSTERPHSRTKPAASS